MPTKTATFAAGCFWATEETFRTQAGVTATVVGHMAGAEVVQAIYDPAQISYETLLIIFWDNHNPTVANPGALERSEIFVHDDEQMTVALQSKATLAGSGKYRKPIVTPISPASEFKRAPEDQQQYYLKHGIASCEMTNAK
jgi:peptide-methionine (S)-S-oxide reductase